MLGGARESQPRASGDRVLRVRTRDLAYYEAYFSEDLSYAKIARRYGVSPEHVRTRIDIVKEDRLRRLLGRSCSTSTRAVLALLEVAP